MQNICSFSLVQLNGLGLFTFDTSRVFRFWLSKAMSHFLLLSTRQNILSAEYSVYMCTNRFSCPAASCCAVGCGTRRIICSFALFYEFGKRMRKVMEHLRAEHHLHCRPFVLSVWTGLAPSLIFFKTITRISLYVWFHRPHVPLWSGFPFSVTAKYTKHV